jgi:hypothetical protein
LSVRMSSRQNGQPRRNPQAQRETRVHPQ